MTGNFGNPTNHLQAITRQIEREGDRVFLDCYVVCIQCITMSDCNTICPAHVLYTIRLCSMWFSIPTASAVRSLQFSHSGLLYICKLYTLDENDYLGAYTIHSLINFHKTANIFEWQNNMYTQNFCYLAQA